MEAQGPPRQGSKSPQLLRLRHRSSALTEHLLWTGLHGDMDSIPGLWHSQYRVATVTCHWLSGEEQKKVMVGPAGMWCGDPTPWLKDAALWPSTGREAPDASNAPSFAGSGLSCDLV